MSAHRLSWLTHPHVRPWAMLGEIPATFLSHQALAGQSPWIGDPAANGAWLSLASLAVPVIAWHTSEDTKPRRRRHITITAAAAGGLFTLGTITGPDAIGLPMLLASALTAVSWNLRKVARLTDGNEPAVAASGDNKILEAINLARTKIRKVEVEPNKATLVIEPPRGEHTPDQVQNALALLPGAAGMRPGSVRTQQDGTDAGLYAVTLTPDNMLDVPQHWPGPRHAGTSVAKAPVEVGRWEDGVHVPVWFAGDKALRRNTTHWRTSGMNGSGKSHCSKLVWTDLFTRPDVAQIGGDPVKGRQTVGPCLDAFEYWGTDIDDLEQLVLCLEDVTQVRGDLLADLGLAEWTPEAWEKARIPFIVCSFEEIPRLLRRGIDLSDAAQTLRSLGVSLGLSAQRWSYRNVDTDVRAQTGGALTFGLEDEADAKFSMSDEAIRAGADPARWGNTEPGCFYAEGPGIDRERIAMPARTYNYSDADLTAVIEAYKPHRTRIDDATAAALGPVFAAYQQERGLALSTVALPTRNLSKEKTVDTEADSAASRMARLLPPIDPTLLDTVDQPIAELDGDIDLIDPRDTGEEMTKEQAMDALKSLLRELLAEGKTKIGPSEIATRYAAHIGGRGRSWTSKAMKALAEASDDDLLRPAKKAGEYYIVAKALQDA
jgi:hypothetical protein